MLVDTGQGRVLRGNELKSTISGASPTGTGWRKTEYC
jgi:hypothetical protein